MLFDPQFKITKGREPNIVNLNGPVYDYLECVTFPQTRLTNDFEKYLYYQNKKMNVFFQSKVKSIESHNN
jgi:hypothetical protein